MTSRRHAGRSVGEVHPFLREVSELTFCEPDPHTIAEGVDAVFLALPHGASADFAGKLLQARPEICLIDLSGDFRLQQETLHQAHYPDPAIHPELRSRFAYGLPELFREEIANARWIANPGCFATGSILALAPLAAAGLLEGAIALDGKTGSSGSGAGASPRTHHPERVGRLAAYSPLTHRHAPEIAQALDRIGSRGRLSFVPHSTPMVRGIYTTAFVPTRARLDSGEVLSIYQAHYGPERFIRVLDRPPDAGVVAGSNFADVWVTASDDHLLAFSAIDNLIKGAAGQAIQNLNLIFDLDEATGLGAPGARP